MNRKLIEIMNRIPVEINSEEFEQWARILKYITELENAVISMVEGDMPDCKYIDHLFDE